MSRCFHENHPFQEMPPPVKPGIQTWTGRRWRVNFSPTNVVQLAEPSADMEVRA